MFLTKGVQWPCNWSIFECNFMSFPISLSLLNYRSDLARHTVCVVSYNRRTRWRENIRTHWTTFVRQPDILNLWQTSIVFRVCGECALTPCHHVTTMNFDCRLLIFPLNIAENISNAVIWYLFQTNCIILVC